MSSLVFRDREGDFAGLGGVPVLCSTLPGVVIGFKASRCVRNRFTAGKLRAQLQLRPPPLSPPASPRPSFAPRRRQLRPPTTQLRAPGIPLRYIGTQQLRRLPASPAARRSPLAAAQPAPPAPGGPAPRPARFGRRQRPAPSFGRPPTPSSAAKPVLCRGQTPSSAVGHERDHARFERGGPVFVGCGPRRAAPAMENVAAVCFDVRRSQELAAVAACTGSAREVERMQPSNARPTDRPQQHRSAGRVNRGHRSSRSTRFSQHRRTSSIAPESSLTNA